MHAARAPRSSTTKTFGTGCSRTAESTTTTRSRARWATLGAACSRCNCTRGSLSRSRTPCIRCTSSSAPPPTRTRSSRSSLTCARAAHRLSLHHSLRTHCAATSAVGGACAVTQVRARCRRRCPCATRRPRSPQDHDQAAAARRASVARACAFAAGGNVPAAHAAHGRPSAVASAARRVLAPVLHGGERQAQRTRRPERPGMGRPRRTDGAPTWPSQPARSCHARHDAMRRVGRAARVNRRAHELHPFGAGPPAASSRPVRREERRAAQPVWQVERAQRVDPACAPRRLACQLPVPRCAARA